MSSEPLRVERRVGQRFEVHLPILIKAGDRTISGFSQDVSSRGVFLYAEAALAEGDNVELTFTMPSEITLGESMRVRCQGRVLRSGAPGAGQRNGVAVQLDAYEYLAENEVVAPVLAAVSTREPETDPAGAVPR